MPFGTTLENESGGYKLFSIGIDDVDRERDRLVVLFTDDKEISKLAFALVNDDTGDNLLRLDRENSTQEAIAGIHDGMQEELSLENPEQTAVYMLADTVTDSTDLILTLPPTIEAIFDRFSCTCELELYEGDVVSVESRTL